MTRRIAILLAGIIISVSGCARFEDRIQTEIVPEPQLYALAMEKFNQNDWDAAIATFERYERLYVNSERVQEVRLKRADAYFNKNNQTSLIIAKSEYQSFLALYPRYDREDYIWLQIAKCSLNQMLPPNRDQSPTREAIKDLENFLERFPNSALVPEARLQLQEAYGNLAQYHIVVGWYYYGRSQYPSASGRFKQAIELNVEIPDLDKVLYALTVSLARTSSHYKALYDFYTRAERDVFIERYKVEHEKSLYEAKQFLLDFKEKFPSQSDKIAELQNEINLVSTISEPDNADS